MAIQEQKAAYLAIWTAVAAISLSLSGCTAGIDVPVHSRSFSEIVSQLNRLNSSTDRGCLDEESAEKVRLKATEDLAKHSRKPVECHLDLGEAYKVKKVPDKALYHFNEAIKLAPEAPNFKARADFYYQSGNYKRAIEDYTRALELQPVSMQECLVTRARAYRYSNDLKNAISDYSSYLKYRPGKFIQQSRADIYLADKQYQKAIEDAEDILRRSPESKAAILTICTAYLEQDKAAKALDAAKSRSKEDFAKYYCLAEAYDKLDKSKEAADSAGQAIRLMAIDNVVASRYDCSELTYSLKNILNLRARAYERLGKSKEAAEDKAQAAYIKAAHEAKRN